MPATGSRLNRHRPVASGSLRLTPDARTDASIVARYGDALFHDPINCFEQVGDLNKRTEELGPALALDAGRFVTPHLETRVSAGYHAEQLRYDDAADGASDPCAGFASHSVDHIRRTIAGARTNAYLGTVAVVTGGVETEWQRWRGTVQEQRQRPGLGSGALGGGPFGLARRELHHLQRR